MRDAILIGMLGLEAILLMVIYFFYRNQYLSLFTTNIAIYAILIFTLAIKPGKIFLSDNSGSTNNKATLV